MADGIVEVRSRFTSPSAEQEAATAAAVAAEEAAAAAAAAEEEAAAAAAAAAAKEAGEAGGGEAASPTSNADRTGGVPTSTVRRKRYAQRALEIGGDQEGEGEDQKEMSEKALKVKLSEARTRELMLASRVQQLTKKLGAQGAAEKAREELEVERSKAKMATARLQESQAKEVELAAKVRQLHRKLGLQGAKAIVGSAGRERDAAVAEARAEALRGAEEREAALKAEVAALRHQLDLLRLQVEPLPAEATASVELAAEATLQELMSESRDAAGADGADEVDPADFWTLASWVESLRLGQVTTHSKWCHSKQCHSKWCHSK